MFCHSYFDGRRLGILALTGTVALAVSQPLWSASCVGPAPLEAQVLSHPNADAYAALGVWFGENRKSECAAQTFQAGLRLEPSSPRLTYLLGLSLFTAGNLTESVAPLRRSIELQPLQRLPTGLPSPKDLYVPDTTEAAMHAYATDVETMRLIATSHELTVRLPDESLSGPFALWRDGRPALAQFVKHLSGS